MPRLLGQCSPFPTRVKAQVDMGSAHQVNQPENPPAVLCPQGPGSLAGMTREALACVSLVGKVLWLVRRSEPGTNTQQLATCAKVQAAQGSWEPLPGLGVGCSLRDLPSWRPPKSGPKTVESASTFLLLGMSLIHVFPVTATTSSHPL